MNQQEIQKLLEISLSIGDSLDLQVMLNRFLEVSVRALGRESAIIIRSSSPRETSPHIMVFSFPEELSKSVKTQQMIATLALEKFDTDEKERALAKIAESAKVIVFDLPTFGILIFTGESQDWSSALSEGFGLLLKKLIQACDACAINSQFIKCSLKASIASKVSGLGYWEWDVDTQNIRWDLRSAKLFGTPPGKMSGKIEDFYAYVNPQDIDNLKAYLQVFLNSASPTNGEYSFRIHEGDSCKKVYTSASWLSAQTLIGVIYDISELELARAESINRSHLESLLTNLSMKVISARGEEIDEITSLALREAGEYVGADRAYRFSYNFKAGTASNTHEWCADGISSQINNLQDEDIANLDLLINSHKQGALYYIKSINELSDEDNLRRILEPQMIKSIITIPLMHGLQCIGFIGFDAVRNERHWTDIDISLLKLLAELLVNTQLKLNHEKTILITSKKLREATVIAEELAEKANNASNEKSRFVASISHEIRTPLHAILGFSDIILEKKTAPEILSHAEAIREAGTSLLDLINDLLDFSKIESRRVKLQESPFNITDLIKNISRMFMPLAGKKDLELIFNTAADTNLSYIGDEQRIRQLLNNIIGNAIKFTTEGRVVVNVRNGKVPGSEETKGSTLKANLIFEVVDTGIGISEDDTSQIFNSFFQVDDSNNRHYGGTGLGLTIVKEIIDLMSATISVKSALGEGTAFTISIPLAHNPNYALSSKTSPPVDPPVKKFRLLFVEDNKINQQVAKIHLKDLNCEYTIANNGAEAIEFLSSCTYDIIMMDCQMPVMDGFEATRQLRLLEADKPRVPVIAITASATQADKELCLSVGMDDVLTKPYSKAEFYTLLNKWILV